MPFRVIIIDDERIAREEVKRCLAAHPDFEVISEALNIIEAQKQIESLRPDVVFLDIQMPGGSGFDLLESLDFIPQVVFTTAYNEYAVRAFEVNALDYLVKPLRKERFINTIERTRNKLADAGNKQIFIKDGNGGHVINISEIFLIESLDNYAKIYYANRSVCTKRSLNQLEKTLDPATFFRINRTYIINTNFIKQIHTLPKGKLTVTLQAGPQLELSARQSVKFKAHRQI